MAPSNSDEVLRQVLQEGQEPRQHFGDVPDAAEDGADAVVAQTVLEEAQKV